MKTSPDKQQDAKTTHSSSQPFFDKKGNFLSASNYHSNTIQRKEKNDIPEDVFFKMENSFGQDFSNVSFYKNSKSADRLNAKAFTQGENIHFAPGYFSPSTSSGQKLIGHELAHVSQQRMGKVKPTTQLKGKHLNDDSALEREADIQGEKAANGEMINDPSMNFSSTASSSKVIQRQTLREHSHNQFDIGMDELSSTFEGQGGILGRQLQAIDDFVFEIRQQDPPPMAEIILEEAIGVLVGSAVTSIGNLIKSKIISRIPNPRQRDVIVGDLEPELSESIDVPDRVRIEHNQQAQEINGQLVEQAGIQSENVLQARGEIRRNTSSEIMDQMVRQARSGSTGYVAQAFASSTSGNVPERFGSVQKRALRSAAQEQISTLRSELAAFRSTSDPDDEWVRANELYQGFRDTIDQAYDIQFNKMTDLWFLLQTQSIGAGDRAGVIGLQLDGISPNGNIVIDDAWIVGQGNNAEIRNRLSRRTLNDIAIPKVIQMHGSFEESWASPFFTINIYGRTARSSGPSFQAPATQGRFAREALDNGQRINGVSVNRWGDAWLAAHYLNLGDLDPSDERVNSNNVARGALKVWNAIKNHRPPSLGTSNSPWR